MTANDNRVVHAIQSARFGTPSGSHCHTPMAVSALNDKNFDQRDMMEANAQFQPESQGALSERDRLLLEFERQWWKYAGAKENAIRDLFDMSATRYYQVLNALIDTEAALDFDPMLVKRLRRMRAERQKQRSARRLGMSR